MSNPRYIYQQQWSEGSKISPVDLSRLYMSKPTVIGPIMTYLYGMKNAFMNPVSLMALAKEEEIGQTGSMDYEYDIMSTTTKNVPLAETCSTTTAGKGFTRFQIKFGTNHFNRYYTLITPNEYKLRIVSDPVPDGSLWVYTVEYVSAKSATDYVPAAELKSGVTMVQGWYNAAHFSSRGSGSNITTPAKVRGNIGNLRKSIQWEGSVANADMSVEMPLRSGGSTKMFWGLQESQIEDQWQREVENRYVYGESMRMPDGTFPFKDEEGNAIIEGDGLLQQVTIKDTFGYTLSQSKINQVIRDVYSNMYDAENKVITLMTGKGGAEDFDNAIKTGLLTGFVGSSNINLPGDKFIEGSGRNMRATGFFVEYDHIDGYTVRVKQTDLFDNGEIARNKPRHPRTGLSIESHRMLFLDTATYDGKPNIIGLKHRDIPFTRDHIKGVGVAPPGFPSGITATSDKHAHSTHYMKSCGVLLRRWTTSIDLQCTAA